MAFLTLNGLGGDDTFNVPGNHPFNGNNPQFGGFLVNGGDPSNSDVLNFVGSGLNPIIADFGATLVQEPPSGRSISSVWRP